MTSVTEKSLSVDRTLRADARRNREAVIAAAKELFADQGLDAQMPDVAKAARVGVGTVYRHFPTKDMLISALVAERFERLAPWAPLRAAGRDWSRSSSTACGRLGARSCRHRPENLGRASRIRRQRGLLPVQADSSDRRGGVAHRGMTQRPWRPRSVPRAFVR